MRDAVPHRHGEQPAAPVELDRGGRLVAVLSNDQDDRDEQGRGAERSGEKEEGGPEPRAALPFLVLPYLIWNFALPVV